MLLCASLNGGLATNRLVAEPGDEGTIHHPD